MTSLARDFSRPRAGVSLMTLSGAPLRLRRVTVLDCHRSYRNYDYALVGGLMIRPCPVGIARISTPRCAAQASNARFCVSYLTKP